MSNQDQEGSREPSLKVSFNWALTSCNWSRCAVPLNRIGFFSCHFSFFGRRHRARRSSDLLLFPGTNINVKLCRHAHSLVISHLSSSVIPQRRTQALTCLMCLSKVTEALLAAFIERHYSLLKFRRRLCSPPGSPLVLINMYDFDKISGLRG